MATARIKKKVYGKLVEAFREQPGNVSHASRKAKVTMRTAKRAWLEGWDAPEWARPIRSVFEQEQLEARELLWKADRDKAHAGARLRDKRKGAKLDAAEERAREAQAVRAAFSSVMTLLGNLGQLSKVSLNMTKQAAEDLQRAVDQREIHWKDAMKLIDRLALTGARTVQQLNGVMEAMRLHTGEAQKIVGFIGDGVSPTQVNGANAVEALGQEAFEKAVIDAVTGNISDEARALFQFQVEHGEVIPN